MALHKHTSIPDADGLFWYFALNKPEPRAVQMNRARWGAKFKSFDGLEQSWLREGEYLLGPVEPPPAQ